MSSLPRRLILLALVSFVLAPATAQAAGVAPSFDPSSPSGAPFPSDRYTVADATQLTGERVDLPKPNCTVRPSRLRGHRRPQHARRLQHPAAALDPLHGRDRRGQRRRAPTSSWSGSPDGAVTGINQVVWEPATNTLHAESDQLLDQHTRYLLVVTNGVSDGAGEPRSSPPRASQDPELRPRQGRR